MATPATATDLRAIASGLFDALHRLSHDGTGITRQSYGPGESSALELIEHFARTEGFATWRDRASNLMVSGDRRHDVPPILIGSHLDSVPQGGNFDGAAGVIAGLLCLLRLRRDAIEPPFPVRVLGLRGEESAWFGKANIGSSALFGKLSPKDLALTLRDTGVPLAQCLRRSGADIDAIAAGEPLLDPRDVASYLELHIEQGPVMVSRGLQTAIVPAIRGNIRHNRLRCLGEAAHSGATPRWLRRDAVFAVADLLMRLDEHWRVLLERGIDLVVTTGIVSTNPAEHAVSRVPGEVTFSLEIRSQSTDTLDAFYALLHRECEALEASRQVTFVFDHRVDTPPAHMHESIVATLLECSRQLGLPPETVPSGPGHDASLFANHGIPSGMIFVRNEHGSHNPREAMAMDDFMAGVDVLYSACRRPDWLLA